MLSRRTFSGLVLASLGLLAWGCADADPIGPIQHIEDLREPASAALTEFLRDGSPATRARAALAMGRIQSTRYADALAEASTAADPAVRDAAIFALGQLGLAEGAAPPPAAVAAIESALGHADPAVVALAAEALGKLAPTDAVTRLLPLLTANDAGVRAEAAAALFRLRFVPVWRKVAKEPPPLPAEAVAGLAAALADASAEVRRAAAHAASRYGEAGAQQALIAALGDDDEWVRLFAARSLGRARVTAATDALATTAGDASPHVRAEAVAALEALEAAERAPGALLEDASFHVRAALARALGAGDLPESLDRLRRLERDDSPTVRGVAIAALARRLGARYANDLATHLADARWPVRVAAARAVGALEPEDATLLERALGDADARVRLAALEARSARPGAEARVDAALASNDLAERGTAVGLLAGSERADRTERLLAAFRDSPGEDWIEVRESIAEALAEAGATEAALREIATGDPAASVRTKARLALAARGVELPEAQSNSAPEPSRWLGVQFEEDPIVVLETSRGTIEIRCLAEAAPIHVASFVERVREGFYDGLAWHRVVPNFVIQGGDPRGDGWGGAGYTLRDEIHPARFARGTVGMPKAGKDTGGGQIFITHLPTPHLDGNYTVFGQVVMGLDVVDRLEVGDVIVSARVARGN